MKRKVRSWVALFTCIALLSGCSGISSRAGELVGTRAPETRLTLLDGSYVPLAGYRGKTVILAFWATWCHTADPAIKRLNELAKKYQPESLTIIAVNLDATDNFEKVRDRVVYQKLSNLEHAFSGNEGQDEAFVAFRGDDLPYFVVMDQQGKVALITKKDSEVADYLQRAAEPIRRG